MRLIGPTSTALQVRTFTSQSPHYLAHLLYFFPHSPPRVPHLCLSSLLPFAQVPRVRSASHWSAFYASPASSNGVDDDVRSHASSWSSYMHPSSPRPDISQTFRDLSFCSSAWPQGSLPDARRSPPLSKPSRSLNSLSLTPPAPVEPTATRLRPSMLPMAMAV